MRQGNVLGMTDTCSVKPQSSYPSSQASGTEHTSTAKKTLDILTVTVGSGMLIAAITSHDLRRWESYLQLLDVPQDRLLLIQGVGLMLVLVVQEAQLLLQLCFSADLQYIQMYSIPEIAFDISKTTACSNR